MQLEITETSPLALAQVALRGDKPAIRIEGDVQLAAEINWLVDNVRWDLEEDLSRVVGDAPAHTISEVARKAAQALRQFVGSRVPPADGSSNTATAYPPAPAPVPPAGNSGSNHSPGADRTGP
jgi:ubiquinone biosynthesis protein UbiJ